MREHYDFLANLDPDVLRPLLATPGCVMPMASVVENVFRIAMLSFLEQNLVVEKQWRIAIGVLSQVDKQWYQSCRAVQSPVQIISGIR